MTISDHPTSYAIVRDLETIPDLKAFARMQGTLDLEPTEAEAQMGEKFQKLPLHKIVCIGALIAQRSGGPWTVRSLGAPHTGEPTEAEIITAFVERIAELRPPLVSTTATAPICRCCATGPWSTTYRRRASAVGRTSIGILTTRSTCATRCRPTTQTAVHALGLARQTEELAERIQLWQGPQGKPRRRHAHHGRDERRAHALRAGMAPQWIGSVQ
jgi:hypothetical protein